LFKLVDVLTLSATPIPRTLYLSLVGVKDMSTIETPPLNRLPVETVVSAYDERIIRAAIDRELERQGQVFFLHNRVATIERVRGRVGRAEHKAYAYLLLPREMMTIGAARKRISAIKQYSSLGAGFRVAMRDLEIRGAGSLLGTAQSGHIVAVGFDLYCQLLKQAVAQLKGDKPRFRLDVDLQLDFVVTNEAEFVPATKTRSGGLQST